MMQIHHLLIGIFILYNVQMVKAIVCYQCTDCPEPFSETYPYVTIINNTNFLAQCMKTIVSFADGHRLISKGSVFFCPTEGNTGDVQVFCCGSDFCNSSIRLSVSMLVLYQLFYILIRTYL